MHVEDKNSLHPLVRDRGPAPPRNLSTRRGGVSRHFSLFKSLSRAHYGPSLIRDKACHRMSVKLRSSPTMRNSRILAELAGLVAEGKLDVPVAATFPLADVRAAFRQLEQGHTRGKIVLAP